LVGARPLVAAARPPDLLNRAKHLFDSAKVVPALTVAPDEKGPALLAGPSRDRSCKRGRVGGIPAGTGKSGVGERSGPRLLVLSPAPVGLYFPFRQFLTTTPRRCWPPATRKSTIS
jgi:hypothetical protein